MKQITRGAGLWLVLGLLVISSVLTSCAPKVRVSTIGTAEGVKEVCLKKETKKNPLLDKLLEEKLKRALLRKGIKVVKECKEFILTYDYGTVPEQMYVPRITYLPGETYTFVVHSVKDGVVVPEYYTVITPSTPVYYTDVSTFYVHYLTLALKKGEEIIWAGEAYIESDKPDFRSVADLLVDVLMQYFGKDTGKLIEVRVEK